MAQAAPRCVGAKAEFVDAQTREVDARVTCNTLLHATRAMEDHAMGSEGLRASLRFLSGESDFCRYSTYARLVCCRIHGCVDVR